MEKNFNEKKLLQQTIKQSLTVDWDISDNVKAFSTSLYGSGRGGGTVQEVETTTTRKLISYHLEKTLLNTT